MLSRQIFDLINDRIECLTTSDFGNVLIIGFHSGLLSFRKIWNLEEIHCINLSIYGAIKSLSFSDGKLNSSLFHFIDIIFDVYRWSTLVCWIRGWNI